MIFRLAASALTVAGLLAWIAQTAAEPAYQRAVATIGETRYQVRFAGQHVGALHNRVQLLRSGAIEVRSDFSTRLSPGEPQRQIKRLVFEAAAPHSLLHASFEVDDQADRSPTLTEFAWRDDEMRFQQTRGPAPQVTPFRYTLGDYLAVELWLESAPDAGTEIIARDLDFTALKPVPQVWQVLELNEAGYLLGTGALRDATTVQMDAALQPVRFQILDALDVLRVDDNAPLPDLAAGMHSRYFHVALDRPLHQHTSLKALELQTDAPDALLDAWPLINDDGVLRSPAAIAASHSAPEPALARGASDDYPTHEPALRALAAELRQRWPEPQVYARELVGWVHDRLRYEHGAPTTAPLETLSRGSGDCTEFAYLYATLARINGIPAQTVSGLAYSPDPEPGFLVHAWNLIWIEGGWRAVDPTWNQTKVDASHLPFPDDSSAGLRILAQLPHTRFKVLSAEYH